MLESGEIVAATHPGVTTVIELDSDRNPATIQSDSESGPTTVEFSPDCGRNPSEL